MAYSSWRSFLTPRKTAREIDRLNGECGSLQKRLDEMDKELAAMRVTVMTSRESEAMSRRRAEDLERRLTDANVRIADLEECIEENRVEEEEYHKIVKAIDSFGEVKARYQERIKDLKRDLDSAREALHKVTNAPPGGYDAGYELLDMPNTRFGIPKSAPAPSKEKRMEEEKKDVNDSDWLQQLPENL